MKDQLSANPLIRRNRFILDSPRELVLLAPSATAIPRCFQNVRTDPRRYDTLLDSMQALRANVYLQDGAVTSSHLRQGRHKQAADAAAWHLLLLDNRDGVVGCARYREHLNDTPFSNLSVARSALAQCSEWGTRLRSSVDAELALSRHLAMPYVELGGWALLEQLRCTGEAIRMALSTYGLAQLLGGGVGISTATFRNSSSSILRRIGGRPLEDGKDELPAYHDPMYGCDMEVLRFYSWAPNAKYSKWVTEFKNTLPNVQIVTNGAADPGWVFRNQFVPTGSMAGLQFSAQSAVLPIN